MQGFRVTQYAAVLGIAGISLSVIATASGEDPQWDNLARRVVDTSVGVQPGDVVVVAGGKHTIELMEAVAAEVTLRGGMPTMFLNSDRVARARFAQMPEQFLGQEPKYFEEWLKHIDVWISVPAFEDPQALWADIPEARMEKNRKAWQTVYDMLNDAKVRLASIGYPTREEAAINGLDFATYEKMYWKAVNTDYQQISEKGNYLKDILKKSRAVRISTTAGTNLKFELGKRPIFVDDGIVTQQEGASNLFLTRVASLPGGALFFAPLETSATGKVVVPRQRCKFEPLTGVSFDFTDGKLKNFNASQGGSCFEQTLAPYSGPKNTIAFISIGLNPEWMVMEDGADFRPQDAAGMVTVGIGDNALYGGKNRNAGSFSFPLVNASVEADGRVLIKDGKLMF